MTMFEIRHAIMKRGGSSPATREVARIIDSLLVVMEGLCRLEGLADEKPTQPKPRRRRSAMNGVEHRPPRRRRRKVTEAEVDRELAVEAPRKIQ